MALHESSTERREALVREVAAAEAEAAAAAAARIAAASTTLAASAMPRGAPSHTEAMVAPPAEREVPRPAPPAQVEELPPHACSVLGELSNSQAQTHAAADKRPELSKMHSSDREVRHDAERAKLKQIRAFLNSQARYIKSRQQQLLETQQEWKRDMRALVAIEMPPEQAAGLHEIMRKVRVMLERQSSRLNEDTEQVQASFRWLRAQEAQRKQARKADNDDAFISSDDSYLSLPRPVDLKAFQIPAAAAAPSFDGLAALSRPAHMEMEFREELRSISEELKNLIGTIVKPIGSDPMLGANPKLTRAPLPTRDVGSWAQQREKVQLLMQLHSRWLRSFRSELAPPLPSAVGKNGSRQAWA
ncbi:hypothetical protein AB1Y20_011589 [Prymnesium parvum]|uniref:Uncharacterized protein n=1 Tax=Prymnesium parvum TaxID=97485 RepID=A0AB34IGB1_PRYPA